MAVPQKKEDASGWLHLPVRWFGGGGGCSVVVLMDVPVAAAAAPATNLLSR